MDDWRERYRFLAEMLDQAIGDQGRQLETLDRLSVAVERMLVVIRRQEEEIAILRRAIILQTPDGQFPPGTLRP